MQWRILLMALVIALIASLGVLFVGEVMGQAPCVLCWYQRAFMFPLAIILSVAAYRGDTGIWRYGMPLALGGLCVAAFHSLLFFGIIPEAIEPCGAGPSCSGSDMAVLGIVPLPLLSSAAFLMIAILLAGIRERTI